MMWIMLLHLHVNLNADGDDADDVRINVACRILVNPFMFRV